MSNNLFVWRIDKDTPRLVGEITVAPLAFFYAEDYLASTNPHAISQSLPLRDMPYSEEELLPYFNGLLPEGETRTAIANALHTTPGDFMSLLLHCGLDIIGDVAITTEDEPIVSGSYEPLTPGDMESLFVSFNTLANNNKESRLSLAGTQGKTGLAHIPGMSEHEGWLRPLGGAASTHILKTSALEDIPFLEYLCMNAARDAGLPVPEVDLFYFGRPVLCIERFDRTVSYADGKLSVERLHAEDLAQAFGITSRQKYTELSPSTASAVSGLIRSYSAKPIEDLEAFARITLFNYLIGNCDNHLKNLSLLYSPAWKSLRLAPAYDLVSTTRYEQFSTNMGMNINSKREISDISAADWIAFAGEIGIHPDEVRFICKDLTEKVQPAISAAANRRGDIPDLYWVADNLGEELYERWLVLDSVANN